MHDVLREEALIVHRKFIKWEDKIKTIPYMHPIFKKKMLRIMMKSGLVSPAALVDKKSDEQM